MKKIISILLLSISMPLFAKVWEFKGVGKDNHFPHCHSIVCPVCKKNIKSQSPQVAIKVTKGLDTDEDGKKYVLYVCSAGHYSKIYKE
ncbi:MAG: hypothetical protein J6Y78_09570 [Paludibacteraceae bacterium]|nr:hypothetical protein [Paludibacteraceae bacterium]